MNNLDYRDPVLLRKMGIDALSNALSPVGMAYFLKQYETGAGDYTREKETFLADITTEDIIAGIAKQQTKG
jgi:hypothetical protein